jgi:hypothetical protein
LRTNDSFVTGLAECPHEDEARQLIDAAGRLIESVRQAWPGSNRRSVVAQSPDVRRDRRELLVSELCPTHRRHGSAILLRLRYSLPDDLLDALVTAITPDPAVAEQRWPERRAGRIRSMTAGAARAASASVKHIVAELDRAP